METLAEVLGLHGGTAAVAGSGGRKAVLSYLSTIPGLMRTDADAGDETPFAAHREGELSIPEGTERVLLVLSAAGFGTPVERAARNPELYCKRSGLTLQDPVTPEAENAVLFAEDIPADTVLVTGVTDEKTRAAALSLAELLHESFPMVRILSVDFGGKAPAWELL